MPNDMFIDGIGMMLVMAAISIAMIAAIGWAVITVVKTICKTVTLNTKIKYFGSSQEYEAFKKWKKEQVADMEEL